jgi:hypothetical protein
MRFLNTVNFLFLKISNTTPSEQTWQTKVYFRVKLLWCCSKKRAIAFGSIRTRQLRTSLTVLIIMGITALVGILAVVSALEHHLLICLHETNTFNTIKRARNTTQSRGGRKNAEIINPIISYPRKR